LLWLVILGGIVSFLLAWALGANDVANAFGTSVGAKVLTLRQAVVIAGIVEFLGAFLMGSHVTDNIRKNLIKPELYEDDPERLMVGMFSALVAATIWLIVATTFCLPVSSTHSMVGAVVGFALLGAGTDGVDWNKLGMIALSWVLSPVLAGTVSCAMFLFTRTFILRHSSALERGLRFLPLCYGFTFGFNTFFVIYKGSPGLALDDLPFWAVITITAGVAILATLIAFFATPYLRRYIEYKHGKQSDTKDEEIQDDAVIYGAISAPDYKLGVQDGQVRESKLSNGDKESLLGKGDNIDKIEQDNQISDTVPQTKTDQIHAKSEVFDPKAEELFSFLQVLTAVFGGFAHGANDVSNAIAPFVVLVIVSETGEAVQNDNTPWWVLLMGGVGIVLGLAMWGYRVMQTIGQDLAKVTPSRGFNIELGSAMTVLGASRLGLPISTTHCKVGSVVGVGLADGREAINWWLFVNVGAAWVITLPATALVSASVFMTLDSLILLA